MSCTLCWKPVAKHSYHISEIQLRNILDKKYGYPAKLNYGDISYLTALDDAGVNGANELINAIEKHDEIEIFLEC